MTDRSKVKLVEESRADRDRQSEEDLRREIELRDAEILRLRDLLIAQEAELGAVRGRLAELENISRGLLMAASRVQRIAPWALRLAGALRRRLRGHSGRSSAG